MPTPKELLDILAHYNDDDIINVRTKDLHELCVKALEFEKIEKVPADTMFNTPALLELISRMEES